MSFENTKVKAVFTGSEEDRSIFTPKEWQIFLLECEGWTKKQIADFVCRSEHTVKTQESAIRAKSNSRSMVEAIGKAIAKGIVTLTALSIMGFACLSSHIQDTQDIRRNRITVRYQRVNRNFRDFIV